MHFLKIFLISFVVLAGLYRQVNAQQDTDQTKLSCNLSVFTDDERKLHEEMSQTIFHNTTNVKELEDGYAFHYTYSDKMFSSLSEWIVNENKCCIFFSFELVLENITETSEIWLIVKGAKDIKQYIESEMLPLVTKN